jgi:hypothetical protein
MICQLLTHHVIWPPSHVAVAKPVPDDFNRNIVEAGWPAEEVAVLAKRWSQKPAAKRQRSA